jgi:hypothetical protein
MFFCSTCPGCDMQLAMAANLTRVVYPATSPEVSKSVAFALRSFPIGTELRRNRSTLSCVWSLWICVTQSWDRVLSIMHVAMISESVCTRLVTLSTWTRHTISIIQCSHDPHFVSGMPVRWFHEAHLANATSQRLPSNMHISRHRPSFPSI